MIFVSVFVFDIIIMCIYNFLILQSDVRLGMIWLWDDFDDWFCFRYLILILIFTWFWFCFRYFTYSMLLVLISCAVYQMMISALKVPWQWFQRWWFFFMNMIIICHDFSGRLPHAPIHSLPLHRPLQVRFCHQFCQNNIFFTISKILW